MVVTITTGTKVMSVHYYHGSIKGGGSHYPRAIRGGGDHH